MTGSKHDKVNRLAMIVAEEILLDAIDVLRIWEVAEDQGEEIDEVEADEILTVAGEILGYLADRVDYHFDGDR